MVLIFLIWELHTQTVTEKRHMIKRRHTPPSITIKSIFDGSSGVTSVQIAIFTIWLILKNILTKTYEKNTMPSMPSRNERSLGMMTSTLRVLLIFTKKTECNKIMTYYWSSCERIKKNGHKSNIHQWPINRSADSWNWYTIWTQILSSWNQKHEICGSKYFLGYISDIWGNAQWRTITPDDGRRNRKEYLHLTCQY